MSSGTTPTVSCWGTARRTGAAGHAPQQDDGVVAEQRDRLDWSTVVHPERRVTEQDSPALAVATSGGDVPDSPPPV